jgi:transcriptional regulator with XRE-family HTH domain
MNEDADQIPKTAPKRVREPKWGRHFIRAWRTYNELSQSELARRAGLSPSALSLVEGGKAPYTQNILEKVSSVLQLKPATLLSRDPFALSDPSDFDLRIRELLLLMNKEQRLLAMDLLETIVRHQKEAERKSSGGIDLSKLIRSEAARMTPPDES